MDAMLVVDMQMGLLRGDPKHDLCGVTERINRLATKVRGDSGKVIFIQHCDGDDFEPQTPGWQFLPELLRDPADIVVRKSLNDPFAETDLQARLEDSQRIGCSLPDGRRISALTRASGRRSPTIITSLSSPTVTR